VTTHEKYNNHSHNTGPPEVRFCDLASLYEKFRSAVSRTDQQLHLFVPIRKAQATTATRNKRDQLVLL
jgi:hypothetical protein